MPSPYEGGGLLDSNPKLNELYDNLRRQIIDRTILPGTKLSENNLGKRWGVSRTPVREVLRRLEAEGLIASEHYKGFYVERITFQDYEQLYTIKINLEGLAGKLATPYFSLPGQMEKLEALCNEMEPLVASGNSEGYTRINHEFHSFICNASQNRWLIKFIDNINSQVYRFIVNTLQISTRLRTSYAEHLRICEMLRSGNAAAVQREIGNHVYNALQELRKEIISQTPRPSNSGHKPNYLRKRRI